MNRTPKQISKQSLKLTAGASTLGLLAALWTCVGCYSDVPNSEGAVAEASTTQESETPPEKVSTETSAEEPTVKEGSNENLADIWDLDSSKDEEPESEPNPSSNPWHTKPNTNSESDDSDEPVQEMGLPWQKKNTDGRMPAGAAKFFGGLTDEAPIEEQPIEEEPLFKKPESSLARTKPRPKADEDDEETAMGSFLEEAYADLPVASDDPKDSKEIASTSRIGSSRPKTSARQSKPNSRVNTKTASRPKPPGIIEIDLPVDIQGVPKRKKPKPSVAKKKLPVPIWEQLPEEPAAPKEQKIARVEPEVPSVEPGVEATSDPDDIDNWNKPVAVASRTPSRLPPPSKEEIPQIEPIIPEPQQPPLLPSVQVRRDNTRHLAWLLGGKLGLARLAVAEGSTDDEARAWIAESRRLAGLLGVDPSEFGLNAPPTPGGAPQRVLALLESAHKASEAVARKYGNDHAALLEASLKANTMLVLYKDRPDLVVPIARAVRSASERAGLSEELWRTPLLDLELSNSDREVYAAVTSLFSSVENDLR